MTKSIIFILHSISIVSILYFLLIAGYSGLRTSFLWFWPFTALCCFAYAMLLRHAALHYKEKPWHFLSPILIVLFWAAFGIVFIAECFLLHAAQKEPLPNAKYVIILGAQVRGTKPSLTLQSRIDTAAAYLAAHSEAIALCSGGQGTGEDISEAQAIHDGLIAAGIQEERILLESKSTNTVENLRFCMELIPSASTPVIIVTNGFHCCRAGLIAKNCGYQESSTLAASQFLLTTPHYYIREFFALFKDFIIGNL